MESAKEAVDFRSALLSLERDTMGETWFKELECEFKKPYFLKVSLVISHIWGYTLLHDFAAERFLDI